MTAKPITCEEILANNHSAANHDGIGNAQKMVTGQAIAAEDGTADDGLQQIVGETHATKDAEVMEHTPNALKSIPC